MDGDFFSTGLSEDDEILFDYDQHPEDYAQDGERCGICMDVVIDRGVLDCCEHWFCFPCIDNWATITNLCPLCQKEFQSITCVPVYDSGGSSKGAEELGSRDDEWSIEEKNNTLLFPSYYIDENAVVCLDGDDCKLRSGLESISEDPNMDTSIACDSCDLWYHAFCVGFDTNNTSDSTWLCPRCTNGEPQISDGTSKNNPGDRLCLHGTEGRYSVESGLSSKVSVSIADTGETAVVVSMVNENQWGEASKENSSNIKVGAPAFNNHGCSMEGDPSVNYAHENSEMLAPNHLTVLESSKRGLSDSMVNNKSKEKKSDKITDDDCSFAEIEGKFETSLYCASSVKCKGISYSNLFLHLYV
uniref:RING-type domain-containing protein n=1 Tax=Kalanchoe fedtschenkoi TaxID=63787 RepID=A0A7N0RC30_KALFE